jgi:hypothetical protein
MDRRIMPFVAGSLLAILATFAVVAAHDPPREIVGARVAYPGGPEVDDPPPGRPAPEAVAPAAVMEVVGTGPSRIVLDGGKSVAAPGAGLEWQAVPPDAALTIRTLRDDAADARPATVAIVTATRPGKYTIMLVATGLDAAGKPVRNYAMRSFTVAGPAPPPAPPPPPGPPDPTPPDPTPPDPGPAPDEGSTRYGLAALVGPLVASAAIPTARVGDGTTRTKAEQAGLIAAVYEDMAAKAGTYHVPQTFVTVTKGRLARRLGPAYAAWEAPVRAPTRARLTELQAAKSGPRIATVADLADAWREVAAGYRAGAAGAAPEAARPSAQAPLRGLP